MVVGFKEAEMFNRVATASLSNMILTHCPGQGKKKEETSDDDGIY